MKTETIRPLYCNLCKFADDLHGILFNRKSAYECCLDSQAYRDFQDPVVALDVQQLQHESWHEWLSGCFVVLDSNTAAANLSAVRSGATVGR